MQSKIMAFWPDGSVKWTAHTADTDVAGSEIEVREAPDIGVLNPIQLKYRNKRIEVNAGCLTFDIPPQSKNIFTNLKLRGKLMIEEADSILLLSEEGQIGKNRAWIEKEYFSRIYRVTEEERGPLLVVVKLEGVHTNKEGEEKIPFCLRIKVGLNNQKIDFVHTLFYNGDENRDFLQGLGIRFVLPMDGPAYNRHVKFTGDHGCFHETAAQLSTWKPHMDEKVYQKQMSGENPESELQDPEIVEEVLSNMPFWNEYELCQDSSEHYVIRKSTGHDNCCFIDCIHGRRTQGGAALGSERGSLLLAEQDFWQKYPSGYTFTGLAKERAEAVLWLWPKMAKAMDFRHYAERGYHKVYYEGYEYKGASAYGIACTNEFSIGFSDKLIPDDKELELFVNTVQKPAQFVGTSDYYHGLKAFGRWSLPGKETQVQRWLEAQLDKAVEFYISEVERRKWYGMFDYGDFMHSYDNVRHQWKYDMGGYAWDNTELVPTMWLWLMFFRTGREDIFTLAEKLSRHASEVDCYHFGTYRGLGSRHNVSHWGCACKETRVAMAGHHRYYYYLTGDFRMGDILKGWSESEKALLHLDPLKDFYCKETMVYPTHVRTGPDWSALCSNWMTQWERFFDETALIKIKTGLADIKKSPLRLISGTDFEFDPGSGHLRYIGDCATGGTHLQVCMGAPQIWIELADLLGDSVFLYMLAEYGRFYFLPTKEKIIQSAGIVKGREFAFPYMASVLGGYGAVYFKDKELASKIWEQLIGALLEAGGQEGFSCVSILNQSNQKDLQEIPWISTNFTAQWCLNVIGALELIGQYLPEKLDELDVLIEREQK